MKSTKHILSTSCPSCLIMFGLIDAAVKSVGPVRQRSVTLLKSNHWSTNVESPLSFTVQNHQLTSV